MLKSGLVGTLCNRIDHLIYPNLLYELFTTTENFEILKSAFKHVNSEPFDKILLLCTNSRTNIEFAYIRLLEPTVKFLYSANEELVIYATIFAMKLIHLRISNDTDIWKFEFHSIIIRNLYRTGNARVACISLRLLCCILGMESMALIFSDPELHLFEAVQNLCLDIKFRPEKYSGEDLYRLLIMCYHIGTQGSSNIRILINYMSNYAKYFSGYRKPYYEELIKMASRLFSGSVYRSIDLKKYEINDLRIWRKFWNECTGKKQIFIKE